MQAESTAALVSRGAPESPGWGSFIYTIIIVILIVILIALGSWVLYLRLQSFGCITNFNIWCSDDWVCQTNCDSTYPVLPFQTGTSPNLASRLYGPDSVLAKACTTDAIDNTGTTGSCSCAIATNAQNCLAGCPLNNGSIQSGVPCCSVNGNNSGCATGTTGPS